MHRCTLSLAVCLSQAALVSAALAVQHDSWIEVAQKASSTLINPATGESAFVLDSLPHPMGVLSPDGKRIAFIGTEPGSDRHTDLFIADVDLTQPSGKASIRRLTTDQPRPTNPQWLPEDRGLVFLAGEGPKTQAWFVSLTPGAAPVALSDARYRAYDLSVTAAGDASYLVHKGSKHKQQFIDLVMLAPSERAMRSAAGMRRRTPLVDQHISGYAVSPDGATIAWSGLGSLFLHTIRTGESCEIPLHAIHPQLANHTAHDIAWRPDGKIIALRCGFLGGVVIVPDEDGVSRPPKMFAQDKIFFVPAEWSPSSEALKVGEGGANPTPFAEEDSQNAPPAAGDQRRPWWVQSPSEHTFGIRWISAEEAKKRIDSSGR